MSRRPPAVGKGSPGNPGQLGSTAARASALACVSENQGCGQSDLGRLLPISRASTMKPVNALVAIGTIQRKADRNQRNNSLVLADAGQQIHAQSSKYLLKSVLPLPILSPIRMQRFSV